jgi:hypothetical protein
MSSYFGGMKRVEVVVYGMLFLENFTHSAEGLMRLDQAKQKLKRVGDLGASAQRPDRFLSLAGLTEVRNRVLSLDSTS